MVLFRHLWRWVMVGFGIRPSRVRPFLAYPGSGFGRPVSVRPVPSTIIRTTGDRLVVYTAGTSPCAVDMGV